MKTAFLAAGLALFSQQAQALSCLRPDAVQTYQTLDAEDQSYAVLLGTLTMQQSSLGGLLDQKRTIDRIAIQPVLPEFDLPPGIQQTFEATFRGSALTRDGFTAPTETTIQITIDCLDIYCGSVPIDQPVMIFVEQGPNGFSLTEGPCAFNVFLDPLPQTIAQIETCMRNGTCGG